KAAYLAKVECLETLPVEPGVLPRGRRDDGFGDQILHSSHVRRLSTRRKGGQRVRRADAISSSCGEPHGRLLWLLRSCLLLMVVIGAGQLRAPQDVESGKAAGARPGGA